MNKRRNVAFGNIDPDELEYYSERAADKPREEREIVIEPGVPESGDSAGSDIGGSDTGSVVSGNESDSGAADASGSVAGAESGSGAGADLGSEAGVDSDYDSGLLGAGILGRGDGTREELIKSELSEYAKVKPEAVAAIIKDMFRNDE